MIAAAGLTALVAGLLLMPGYIRTVKRLAWGQQIREEGPRDHQSKKGTPTMGGLVIVAATALGMAWACIGSRSWDVLVMLLCILANTAIGFIDDFAKVRNKRNLGLSSRHKLSAQFTVACVVAVYVLTRVPHGEFIHFPGIGETHSAILSGILTVIVVISTSNAVNLTDGLDGLAAGTVAAAAAAYGAICLVAGRTDLAAGAAAMTGACLAFLHYNRYPARIFMGDTGSLALGGGLASLAVMTRSEWLLVVIGGVFVVETLSVILQVAYFKATKGKRIFRMSPLHHHFCLGGTPEVRVTSGFWLAGCLLAVLGFGLWFMQRSTWSAI